MLKKILLSSIILYSLNSFAQNTYRKHWGSLYPVKTIPSNTARGTDTIKYRNTAILASVDKKTNRLYVVEDMNASPAPPLGSKYIYEFNETNNAIKHILVDLFSISQILCDNNNLILVGKKSLRSSDAIFKYNLTTSTLTQILSVPLQDGKQSVVFDANNNMYILYKSPKTAVLSPSYFQNTGDQNTIINNQDVISKYDSTGRHVWSTFYFNNQSHIWGIAVGTGGLYVYGHEFLTTPTSSYFGTANGYQPQASGITRNNDPKSGKNAFLAKFSFDGRRLWGTYFGTQISSIPIQQTLMNNKSLEVVGDEAYIITDHFLPKGINNQLHTSDAAIQNRNDITEAKTLTKFSPDGKRLFTSYLYDTEFMHVTPANDIMLSGTNNLTIKLPQGTSDAYQQNLAGTHDNITYTITADGKKLTYLSYFGDYLKEDGIAIPSQNGYYIIGGTIDYPSETSRIPTQNAQFNKLEIISTIYRPREYVGNYISFMTNKTLSIKEEGASAEIFNSIKVYPNPTENYLKIESFKEIPLASNLSIYDINGKRLINQKTDDTHLNTINVSHLATGIYILELEIQGNKYHTKIIKK